MTMKKILTMVMMMTIAISAAAMPYNTARNEALFLSDKMAYELGLTATQYDAVYEINLDYLLNIDTRSDVFGFWWEVRNRDLSYVLSTWQYERYMASTWFYRPLSWSTGGWTFSIYSRYAMDRMFYHRPAVFVTFKGGHSHKGGSYYSGHHFDKPNPPKGNGNNNNNNNNGSWSHNGNNHNNNNHNNGNHNNNGSWSHNNNGNNNNNGSWSHNGNNNGKGNGSNPSVVGNGNSHRSGTTTTPSRTFGSRPSGSVAIKSNNATKGNFGGARK